MWWICILALVAGAFAKPTNGNLHVVLNPEKKHQITETIENTTIVLKWNTSYVDQSVTFDVTLSDNKLEWVSIGFSDHGKLNNSDLCVFKDGKLQDYYVSNTFDISLDRKQDCELIKSDKKGFQFKRKFATCDPKDYALEKGTTQFIISGGHKFPAKFDSPDATKYIQFAKVIKEDPEELPLEKDSFNFTFGANNASIPATTTAYWCVVQELPKAVQERKHHLLRLKFHIQPGNEHLVHHMKVLECQTDDQTIWSGDCHDGTAPKASMSCNRVMSAWALGMGPVIYPPEAGLPIGGPEGKRFMKVEIHFNNLEKETGVVDNSGFVFDVTPTLRKYDAGIMELGNIFSDANSIPPNQADFPITGYCVPDCTSKFPEGGIHVFGSMMHSHLTGRKMWTSHYRNGVKIGEMNRDHHYDSHWQHIQQVRPYTHVLPGDLLATTCVYETHDRAKVALGGFATKDEMCVNFFYYFPAAPVQKCKSSVDNGTLHSYFADRYGIKDKRLRISDKYNKVDWNEDNVLSLKELYATAPLNMACTQHNGLRFPNHPLNWTAVPIPEVRAAPMVSHRDDYECPALNI